MKNCNVQVFGLLKVYLSVFKFCICNTVYVAGKILIHSADMKSAHAYVFQSKSAFLTVSDTFWFYILDIDECASGKAICPYKRRCVNTFGSYYCKCHVGFELKYISGRYDCIGKIWWHLSLFPLPTTCSLSLELFEFSLLVEQSTVPTSLATEEVTFFYISGI